jgi:transcriptional regulator with XRE-family HTH domain
MASELGITPGAYAKIERGETDVSITRLGQIADALGVKIGSLLQENHPVSIVEEAGNPYGFASKAELEQLAQMIRQINRELEKIRAEMSDKKKGKSRLSK